jgi:hypothetical protein
VSSTTHIYIYDYNNEKDINWKWGIVEIKEGRAYSALLKLFTTKDEESGDFICSNLELRNND